MNNWILIFLIISNGVLAQSTTTNYQHLWTDIYSFGDIPPPVHFGWYGDKKPYPVFEQIPGSTDVISLFGNHVRRINEDGVEWKVGNFAGQVLFTELSNDKYFVCWDQSDREYPAIHFADYDYEGNILNETIDTLSTATLDYPLLIDGFELENDLVLVFVEQRYNFDPGPDGFILYNKNGLRILNKQSPIDFTDSPFIFQTDEQSVWVISNDGQAFKLDTETGNTLDTKSIGSGGLIKEIKTIEGENNFYALQKNKIEYYDENLELLKTISINPTQLAQSKAWDFINEKEVLIYGDDDLEHQIQLVNLSTGSIEWQLMLAPQINRDLKEAMWIEYENGNFYVFGSSLPASHEAYWEILKIDLVTQEVKRVWGWKYQSTGAPWQYIPPTCINFYAKDSISLVTFAVENGGVGADENVKHQTILLEDKRGRTETKLLGRFFEDTNFNCRYDPGEEGVRGLKICQWNTWDATCYDTKFSDSNGEFYIYSQWKNRPEQFNFKIELPDHLEVCPYDLYDYWWQESDTIYWDIPVIDNSICKGLRVDIDIVGSTKWCKPGQIKVTVFNRNDTLYSEVKVELKLDAFFEVENISATNYHVDGDLLILDIDQINQNDSLIVFIDGNFDCDFATETNFNVAAEIFPQLDCQINRPYLISDTDSSLVTSNCPKFSLGLSNTRLHVCEKNTLFFNYRNIGNENATNVQVEMELDSFMQNPVVDNHDFTFDGKVLKILLNDIEIGEDLSFNIKFEVSCETPIGFNHKIKTHLFSDAQCIDNVHVIFDDFFIENTFSFTDDFRLRFYQLNQTTTTLYSNFPTEVEYEFENRTIDTITSFQISLKSLIPDFIKMSDFYSPVNEGILSIDSINRMVTLTKNNLDLEPGGKVTLKFGLENCKYKSDFKQFKFLQNGEIEGKKLRRIDLKENNISKNYTEQGWRVFPQVSIKQNGIPQTDGVNLEETIEIEFAIRNNQNIDFTELFFQLHFTEAINDVSIEEVLSPHFESSSIDSNKIELKFDGLNLSPDETYTFSIKLNLKENYPVVPDQIRFNHTFEGLNGCVYFQTLEMNYFIDVLKTTGTKIDEILGQLSIFPNPSKSLINFRFQTPISKPHHFELYNIAGQKLLFRKVSGDFVIEKSEVGTGVFFFEMKESGVVVERGKLVFLN